MERGLKTLLIGGPDGARPLGLEGLTVVESGYVGIMSAPSLSDFPVMVFWPDSKVFSLPGNKEEWLDFCETTAQEHDLAVPSAYWARSGAFQQPETIVITPELLALEAALFNNVKRRLQDRLLLSASGFLTVVVVPMDYLNWKNRLATHLFSWFASGIVVTESPGDSYHVVEEWQQAPGWVRHNQNLSVLAKMKAVIPDTWPFTFHLHAQDLGSELQEAGYDFGPGYGETTWANLMAGVAPDVAPHVLSGEDLKEWERNSFQWPGGKLPVYAIPGHRRIMSPHGDPKSLAFLCGEGAVVVVPEPQSLEGLLNAIAPLKENQSREVATREGIRASLKALLENVPEASLSFTSCLQNADHLIDALVSSKTKVQFYQHFRHPETGEPMASDPIRRAIKRLAKRKAIPDAFFRQVITMIDELPTR